MLWGAMECCEVPWVRGAVGCYGCCEVPRVRGAVGCYYCLGPMTYIYI